MTGLDKEGNPKVLSIEPADIPCGVVHYREEARHCSRLGRFTRALADFDIAYGVDERDWRTVVMRARTAMRASRFDEALAGARRALDEDQDDIDALLIEAQALYNLGEFEKALMIAHRGWKKRKTPPEFAEVIFAAEETIEDCIGRNVGPIMLEFLDLIYTMEKEREEEETLASQRRDDPCLFLEDQGDADAQGGTASQRQCRARLQAYMCSKYLGRLCADKRFLERINNPAAMVGPNQKCIDKLLAQVREGIDFLQKRQEMLRERMPLYSIRYRETIHSESVRKRRRQMLEKKREVVRNTALAQLEQLRRARMEKNYKTFFHTLERCYEYLVGQSENVMPMKRSFQEALYNLAGIGYLDMKTLRKEDSEERRMLQAQMIMSVITPHGPAIDAVLAGTVLPRVDIKKRLALDEQRLQGSDMHLERAWIFADMCFENCLGRRFDMVRFYGRKCIAEARVVDHWPWCINALMYIAKSEMVQHNKLEALHALQEATEFALKLKNEDVLELLDVCMEAVREAQPEAPLSPRQAREKKIMDRMVGEEMMDQAQVLMYCIADRERARNATLKKKAAEEIRAAKKAKAELDKKETESS